MTKIFTRVKDIFNNYYLILEHWVKRAQTENLGEEIIQKGKAAIQQANDTFWNLPEFKTVKKKETYFNTVQGYLKSQGYFLDITPQYGIATGGLRFKTIDNISLRSILRKESRVVCAKERVIEYTEYILGKNLIHLPSFIEPIVESTSSSAICIFPDELQKIINADFKQYKKYSAEANKRFVPNKVSDDNLFCILLKLYERQWGENPPRKQEINLLIKHFRLHGEQHIVDFYLLNSHKLKLSSSNKLKKDVLLEARVMVRQLLDGSLPFYTLSLIIIFQREWMAGSRSEYALAGHILFDGFVKEMISNTKNEIQKFSEDEIYRSARKYAGNNKNFFNIAVGNG